MAKAWVQDLWVKDHIVRNEDGTIKQRLKPTSKQLQAIGKLPEEYRSKTYGRGSRWRANWFEQLQGKPVRKTADYATKAQAENKITEVKTSLASGSHVASSLRLQKVSAVADAWLRSKQKIRESSRKKYQDELDRYVLPKWGRRAIDSITSTEVEEWVDELRTGTAPHNFKIDRKQQPLRASAIKHVVRITFGAIMGYAVNKRWLTYSPVTGVELPDAEATDVDSQIIEPIELQALIEAAQTISVQDANILRVLGFAGLRIGEVFALQVEDWHNGVLTVRHTLSEAATGVKLAPPKSGASRSFPVAPIAAEALNEQVKDQPPNAYIFRNSKGGHLNVHNWRARVFGRTVDRAGLEVPGFTPHSLRHTAASMAISANANILIIQRMLGHKNPNITLETYSHLYPSDLNKIGDLIHQKYEEGLKATDRSLIDQRKDN